MNPREHFAHHPLHLAVCAIAVVIVVAAIALGAPILGALGALTCAAMMIGMIWMMVGHGRSH